MNQMLEDVDPAALLRLWTLLGQLKTGPWLQITIHFKPGCKYIYFCCKVECLGYKDGIIANVKHFGGLIILRSPGRKPFLSVFGLSRQLHVIRPWSLTFIIELLLLQWSSEFHQRREGLKPCTWKQLQFLICPKDVPRYMFASLKPTCITY